MIDMAPSGLVHGQPEVCISRRAFLGSSGSFLAGLLAIGCTLTKSDEGAGTNQTLRSLPATVLTTLESLPPPIKIQIEADAALRSLEGDRLIVLIEFFAQANRNGNLDGWLPLALASDREGVELERLAVDVQLTVLEMNLFKFFDLHHRQPLLLIASTPWKVPPIGIARHLETIQHYLPEVDDFVGRLYKSPWLHIEFYAPGSVTYTVGFNILLAPGGERFSEVLVHELAHTYNSHLAATTPVFITEGIPDVIAEIFTGRAAYGSYQTSAQVHLGVTSGSEGRLILAEGANGYGFFRDLRALVGAGPFRQAVQTIFGQNIASALMVLRIFKAVAPSRPDLERLFVARIADYVPSST